MDDARLIGVTVHRRSSGPLVTTFSRRSAVRSDWTEGRSVWPKVFAGIFVVEFGWLAISPRDRSTWLLENLLVAALFVAWPSASRRIRISPASTVRVFAFLIVHEIGAHYTYSEVPYDSWTRALVGTSLNESLGWERNHFDRAIHFLYGLWLTDPMREVVLQTTKVRGIRSYLLPVAICFATSVVYEGIELGWAWIAGGEAAAQYLGAQGDEWDGTKDVALACAGAVLAMALRFAMSRRRRQAP